MDKRDRIISELLDALDIIGRANDLDYIRGVVEGATKRANAERARNADGYLVVKA